MYIQINWIKLKLCGALFSFRSGCVGKCDGRGATLQFMIDLILYIGPISCGRVKLCVECFGIKLKISCYRGHSGLEDHQIQNKNVVPETAEKLLAFLIN